MALAGTFGIDKKGRVPGRLQREQIFVQVQPVDFHPGLMEYQPAFLRPGFFNDKFQRF